MTNHQPLSKYAIHKLLQFLLTLFEQQKSFETLFHITEKNIANWLVELPLVFDLVDLNTQKITVPIEEALNLANPQTPVIGVFKNGGLLVFYGFKSGNFRVVHIHKEQSEEHLFSLKEVLKFLNEDEKSSFDFLMIQARKPFEQVVSHEHEHLTPFERLTSLLKTERTDLWLIFGLAIGSGLLALSAPIAVQALVNTVAMGGMGQPLAVLSG